MSRNGVREHVGPSTSAADEVAMRVGALRSRLDTVQGNSGERAPTILTCKKMSYSSCGHERAGEVLERTHGTGTSDRIASYGELLDDLPTMADDGFSH